MAKFKDLEKFDGFNMKLDYEDIVKKNAKELASEIKSDAKSKWKNSDYAKGWTSHNKRDKRRSYYSIVYNKDMYQLTHLLEFGHVIWNSIKPGKMRRTSPRPHIKPHVEKQFKKYIADMERCPIVEEN